MNKILLLEAKLEVARKVNNILLNSGHEQSINAKTVGMFIDNILSILDSLVRELKEIKSQEVKNA